MGWTGRHQFEETWVSLLSSLSPNPDIDNTDQEEMTAIMQVMVWIISFSHGNFVLYEKKRIKFEFPIANRHDDLKENKFILLGLFSPKNKNMYNWGPY